MQGYTSMAPPFTPPLGHRLLCKRGIHHFQILQFLHLPVLLIRQGHSSCDGECVSVLFQGRHYVVLKEKARGVWVLQAVTGSTHC
ncbi:hypothetical protein M404DRAFT_647606 [Pisolithus tinctorius Marx 270]|uniref:Uncharacterized protein n=1 Tax=Pisolithus tinctorius Marx 270 TaxID=870435 RepID=A0A0C3JZR7_PISTI|nr:hypothetical protein M404DRAFT_647606 [Pisolithus tinctorius Marx 270]